MATAYWTTLDLSPYLVDKDTGAPLAGGYVQFWEDADRTVAKLVYEKQNIGADPVTGNPIYQFVPLTDPLIISGVGTLQNANGDNVAVYYYPFDANGNEQLYYVAVFNYLGVPQFTREGWGFPSSAGSGGGGDTGNGTSENMISNPQFVDVNFNTVIGLTVYFSGSGTTNIPIAADWNLQVIHAGAGNITINRTAVAGSQNYATNPPYILSITPGSNISSVTLFQQLPHNPGIWTPQTTDIAGYIASNILLGPGTSATISYTPSTSAPTQLLMANNVSSAYVEYTNTTQLAPSTNTDTADLGYVNISIALSTSATSLLSSVQILGMNDNITGVVFNQETVNRQLDHLFNYYRDRLEFKPIPSYLVGWDFPLNPTQFLGASVAAQAVGANKSYYAWDQTIVFQTANSGLTISRDTTGGLKVLAAAAGQHALIQYLPAPLAIEMLSRRKCVMVSANGSVATTATVSLWYTKTTLPSTIGSNLALPLTLDANGYPATQNGTWVQVPRNNLSNSTVANNTYTNAAQFTIPVAPSGAASFNHIPLNGWDMQGVTDINSATFFAIVVGTANLAQNAYILWQDITCQDGDIPTVTGAQTADEVLRKCQYYFCSSFNPGVVPATQQLGVGGLTLVTEVLSSGGAAAYSAQVPYPTKMYAAPTTITTYNPINNNAQMYDFSLDTDCSGTTVAGYTVPPTAYNLNNQYGFFVHALGSSPSSGDVGGFAWTADARLGQ